VGLLTNLFHRKVTSASDIFPEEIDQVPVCANRTHPLHQVYGELLQCLHPAFFTALENVACGLPGDRAR
jgi:hypothetical protein